MGVVLNDAVSGFFSHQAQTRGAAIAYYTLFSLAPMLLVAIAVAGIAFGEEAARGEILRRLSALIGTTGAAAVQDLLASVQRHGQGGWGAIVGLGLLLVGATTVFAELQAALDEVWRDTPPGRGSWPASTLAHAAASSVARLRL
ncbi:MAG: YihY/virulence factor BrkB family protein [Rubrivivax sp.]|nr:YihY/virulence factor BrkB family protein [Rubrivivax sp.]